MTVHRRILVVPSMRSASQASGRRLRRLDHTGLARTAAPEVGGGVASGRVPALLRGLPLALLLIGGVAWAGDPLAEARKAIGESDYATARSELAIARDAGGRSPAETAEMYRLSGIAEAALGDAKAATDAFARLLALSPDAALPAGTSPKIKRPFDAASLSLAANAPLEVRLETGSAPPTITLIVVSDPLDMIATVHVVFAIDGGAEQTQDAVASKRTAIALPAGKRIDARIAALDEHGNHLADIGSKDVPIVIIGEAAPVAAPVVVAPVARSRPEQAAERPIYLRWWPYAAVAGAFGAGAGYFAWSAHSDANDLTRLNGDSVHHPFSDAQAVERRGQRDALLTNIGLGAASAFAIAAGVMYLTTPRAHVEARVAAVPMQGGGAIVVGGRF